ncbi:hypothetical protein PIROE2DRAFT_12864 [Piromyces sp. E2]|nr:hypothetical protein PIROE2DRAFT_12864 [Piromyces sp. E2]|eukprot:OUM61192.1 hypothetical protein PIROE2DRAFT_12864 [Piromyces sp. E2]
MDSLQEEVEIDDSLSQEEKDNKAFELLKNYKNENDKIEKNLPRDPTSEVWMQYIKKFKSNFKSETRGTILLIVGHVHDKMYCEIFFPNSSSIDSNSKKY